MLRKLTLLPFTALLAATVVARAQESAPAATAAANEPVMLDRVTVTTATRTEKAIEKIPGAIELVTRADLQMQSLIAEDPSQVLEMHVPGFAPSRQKLTQTGESLRGRPVLYLLDGIPQSNPLRSGMREGYFADSLIVDRIEVVSGANAIHGAGATGGIINYITKTPSAFGTRHSLDVQLSTQFEDDDLGWKAGYSLQHRSKAFDGLFYAGVQRRGLTYDGEGRPIGIDNVQGDTIDSFAYDLFLKLGHDFANSQRLQLTANRFDLEGDGDYRNTLGNRATGQPTTSTRGTPRGEAPRNLITSLGLEYDHRALWEGSLSAQVFKQDFSSLYGATNAITFQDTTIAPQGTLYDQSEIIAKKLGAKLTYSRPNTFVEGLELTGGLDWLNDKTQQRLAGTDRVWVPPMEYSSVAPFAQAEYERGRFTFRSGIRYENATLDVAPFQTLAFYGRQSVQGGKLSFSEPVFNAGAVVRLGAGLSAFAAYTEGFGLPDVGLILRAVNQPGRRVDQLLELVPVLTENVETGFTWRGKRGSATLSVYESKSDLSGVVRIDARGIGQVDRVPTRVRGAELAADWRPFRSLTLSAAGAILDGKTATSAGKPLDLSLGARNIGPKKLVLGATWQPTSDLTFRLQSKTLFDRDVNVGRNTSTTRFEEHFNGYTLFDGAVAWRTARGTWSLGIENLLDRQYYGYYVQADINSVLSNDTYFAGRGRTVTVRYSLEF